MRPAQIAVFDFDGTSIDGNSPVLLVTHLLKNKMLRKRDASAIAAWGAAYKLRLPQNESWVRGKVFSAFEGLPATQVDAFLTQFYDDEIEPIFRPAADEAMRRHVQEGHTVVVVSATFEPIVKRAMQLHPFQYELSTRMHVAPDGTYTRQVEGLPVEGAEKLAALTRFANKKFGVGAWEIHSAYGDHHSDRSILSAARHAFAVCPDRPLSRTARDQGWGVLEW